MTFAILAATIIGILPGAVSIWAYERNAGTWGLNSPDRLYRFVGASAAFGVLGAPLTYWLWRHYVESGAVTRGEPLPLWLWGILALYALVPAAIGYLLGLTVSSRTRVGRGLRGPSAPPRAWDALFHERPEGIVRIKLKSGTWLAGVFGGAGSQRAYASGFPEDGDLLLAGSVAVDPRTGEYDLDEDRRPVIRKTEILIDWTQVEYLLFDRIKEGT